MADASPDERPISDPIADARAVVLEAVGAWAVRAFTESCATDGAYWHKLAVTPQQKALDAALVGYRDAIAAPLVAALREYEAWEADLILEAACWADGLPMLTQDLYDRAIAIQTKRNAALAAYSTEVEG